MKIQLKFVLGIVGLLGLFAQGVAQEDYICGTSDLNQEVVSLKRGSDAAAPEVRTVMVVRVDFADEPFAIDTTDIDETNVIVGDFYVEGSYDLINLEFIYSNGVLHAPGNAVDYGGSGWNDFRNFVRDGVEGLGYEKGTDYDYYIAVFPRIDVGWSGLSYGSRSGDNYINGSYGSGVVAHELGHAFSLPHASAVVGSSDLEILGGNTEKQEYGDRFDVMGGGGSAGAFNLEYKERIGWVEESDFQTVTATGTYRIYAHDTPTKGAVPMGLIIETGVDGEDNDGPVRYLLDYRTSYSSTSSSSNARNTRNGVGVRLINYFNNNTGLLDMHPEAGESGSSKFNDAILNLNEEYVDQLAGGFFTLRPVAINDGVWDHNGYIDVEIEFTGSPVVKGTLLPYKQWSVSQAPNKGLLVRTLTQSHNQSWSLKLKDLQSREVFNTQGRGNSLVDVKEITSGVYLVQLQVLGVEAPVYHRIVID